MSLDKMSLNKVLHDNSLKGKKILIVSLWGWPIFGGGEQFLYDSMKWCAEEGMIVSWICFERANVDHDKGSFDQMHTVQSPYGTIIQVPGGFNEITVKNWIQLINPHIVHHQGNKRYEIVRACHEIGYKIITGICFWNDIIELNPQTMNIDIIKNASLHHESPRFLDILNWSASVYSASDFVTDVVYHITGKKIKDLVYSSSLKENCLVNITDKFNQTYVTLINCHALKGGKVLLECMRRLPQIPFLVVHTESGSSDLDNEIQREMQNRKAKGHATCMFIERQHNIKDILKQTKILLVPSLVDETFCKTANEAMCNGIPIVTTGKGNISYMVGDTAIICSHNKPNAWVEAIDQLYHNEELYENLSFKTARRYELYSEKVAHNQLISLVKKVLFNEQKQKNIMIYVPWCDQGLGIQARTYVKLFEMAGFTTHIFSYKPYFADPHNPKFQANSMEWVHPSVYYSMHDREGVTDDEIISFIRHRNINILVIPETCFDRVYQVAEIARKEGCGAYCIPNIEIVRKSEMSKYEVFNKILCNNELCKKQFNEFNYMNTSLVGYSACDKRLKFRMKDTDDIKQRKIKFLALGGLNAIVRKQVLKICEGFAIAHNELPEISLCVCIQGSQIPKDLELYRGASGIEIIIEHMQYGDIINKYYECDISIQVSKHEGLGLGFYESLASGTPVISLNTAPHNEIIREDETGWLLPCTHETMKDNSESLIESAIFKPVDLAQKIIHLARNPENILKVLSKIKSTYEENYSAEIIANNFKNAFDS
jgi:glycosyltransferase involved in cell wall biosynthesis